MYAIARQKKKGIANREGANAKEAAKAKKKGIGDFAVCSQNGAARDVGSGLDIHRTALPPLVYYFNYITSVS